MIITRFAPSPTGHLHLGNMRSCFLNWAYSKKNNGKFILRYDDTDQERSKDEYVESIASDLDWLKIKYDETFYQSKRILKREPTKQEFEDFLKFIVNKKSDLEHLW